MKFEHWRGTTLNGMFFCGVNTPEAKANRDLLTHNGWGVYKPLRELRRAGNARGLRQP